MVFQRTKVASALGLLLGAGGASILASPALAQDIRVEVTGSSIRRVEAEGALPVQVYTRADIERTGATSMADLIQSLPVFSNFTTQGDSVGGGGAGFAGAGLRQQGEFRTLVLLNGKRLAPFGGQALTGGLAAVNINNLPTTAIERIEVLTDGASALYGSDAIGGVVNFITRRDVNFLEITAGGVWPEGGDGKETNFSAMKGFGTLDKEGYNLLLMASRDDRDPLKAIDRSFAKSGVFNFTEHGRLFQFRFGSATPIPANLQIPGALFSPTLTRDGSCGVNTVLIEGLCQFDFTALLEIYPEQTRDNAMVSFTKKLGANHQFSIDYLYSKSETTSRLAPPPGTFNITSTSPLWPQVLGFLAAEGLPVPATNRVTARWRADVGQRTTEDVSEANHVSAELKGTIEKWDYSASYTRSQSKYESNLKGGWAQLGPFLRALNSGLVDPFVPAGNQPAAARALLDESIIFGYFDGGKTTIDYIDIHGSRPIWTLPGGDVQLALGASWLKEKFDSLPSLLAQGLDPDGQRFGDTSAIIPYSANRTSYGVFAEALIPVTREFEVTPAVRFDDYEDFGNTTNYKISFRYQPMRQLLFRGSYGTGFKAPTVPQLNAAPQPFGVTGNEYSCNADPRLQQIADSLGVLCPAGGAGIQFDQLAGGNPLLQPEKAKQWTLGVRWEPNPNFGIGLDFWEVKLDNQIGQIDEAEVFGNPLQYPQSFAVFIDPATGDPLLAFNATNVNLGKAETAGVDLDIQYRQPFAGGNFRSNFFGTYIYNNKYQVIPGGPYIDDLGQFVLGNATIKFKAKWVNTIEMGNWDGTIAVNYMSGFDDDRFDNGAVFDAATGDPVVLQRRVDSHTTVDLQGRWRFAKNWTFTAGVLNVFSNAPPLSITTDGGGQMVGYNADYHDPRERTFYAKLAFRW